MTETHTRMFLGVGDPPLATTPFPPSLVDLDGAAKLLPPAAALVPPSTWMLWKPPQSLSAATYGDPEAMVGGWTGRATRREK